MERQANGKQLLKQKRSNCLSKHPSKKPSNSQANHKERKKETTLSVEQGAVDNCPATEPAEPKGLAEKKPSDLTRAELDQIYAAKRNPQPAAGAPP